LGPAQGFSMTQVRPQVRIMQEPTEVVLRCTGLGPVCTGRDFPLLKEEGGDVWQVFLGDRLECITGHESLVLV
jgi:hypothetical protein